jgi:hypothetical protein
MVNAFRISKAVVLRNHRFLISRRSQSFGRPAYLHQSSSASRFAAAEARFFDLSQSGDRPDDRSNPSVSRRSPLEVRYAGVVAGHRLAVHHHRTATQAGQGRDDKWKAIGQVIAGSAVELHAVAFFPRDHSETVMFDFVQPKLAGRRLGRAGRKARGDETGRVPVRLVVTPQHGSPIARRGPQCQALSFCNESRRMAGRLFLKPSR